MTAKRLAGAVSPAAQEKDRARAEKTAVELLGQIKKLVVEIGDRTARLEEVLLTGGTSADAVWLWWVKCWERKTGVAYTGSVARGKGVIRKLLKTISAADLQHRIIRFLSEADDWTVRNDYPIEGFARSVHSLSGQRRGGRPASLDFLATLEEEGSFKDVG